jgi:hypothetical protein
MWGYIPGGAVIGTARHAGGRSKGRKRARAQAKARARWSNGVSVKEIAGGLALMFGFLFIVALVL